MGNVGAKTKPVIKKKSEIFNMVSRSKMQMKEGK
jgi:hypothetical protein